MRNFGKPNQRFFQRVIFPKLGAKRREVVVGPRFGVDNAVVRVGNRQVMIATADPLSFIPALGPDDSAWLSVNLLASDLTTSGLAPQYGIFDFNLPPRMKNSEFTHYWNAFHAECKRLGVAVIGGHTGRYQGCDYTVIGGGVMYAIGEEGQYLISTMAHDADDIILTKGAAIEATAVLTRSFPKTVRRALGAGLFKKAWTYLRRVSTIKDALTAASVGIHEDGVTAMHDATEGGVLAAVMEVANASRLGGELDLPSIHVSQETEEICRFFQIDPSVALSEGSLILTCRPHRTARVLTRLNAAGIESHVIGQLTSKTPHVFGTGRGGRMRMRYPKADPYWKAYWKATKRRWN